MINDCSFSFFFLKELLRNKLRLHDATTKYDYEISICSHYLSREDLLRKKRQVEHDVGITDLKMKLVEQNQSSGHSFCSSGRDFEILSHEYVCRTLLPEISTKYGISLDCLRVISNITLKLPCTRGSSGEVDAFIVEIDPQEEAPLTVVRKVLLLIEM